MWYGVDPRASKYPGWSPFNYVLGNPIGNIDPKGDTVKVMVYDQDVRPLDNGTRGSSYTASIFVFDTETGDLVGPYSGSSYPNSISNTNNSTNSNTVNSGEIPYNNSSGHKGSTLKGLNLVDANGARNAPGTSSSGTDVTMQYVNVHAGASNNGNYNSRGSDGCITLCPGTGSDQADAFFQNFNWTNTAGTTGNSSGVINIHRLDASSTQKSILKLQERATVIKESIYYPEY